MKRDKTSGITQLELMISLSIMGMIAVLLANAFSFNRQSLASSQMLTTDLGYLLVQHNLKDWVGNMPLSSGREDRMVFLRGDADSLRFKTVISDKSFWGGEPTKFALKVVPATDGSTLELTGSGLHSETRVPYKIRLELAADVSKFQASYFGRTSSRPSKQWYKNWSDDIYLPELVKLEWDNEQGKPAPPLILLPSRISRQRFISLSSLVPPG